MNANTHAGCIARKADKHTWCGVDDVVGRFVCGGTGSAGSSRRSRCTLRIALPRKAACSFVAAALRLGALISGEAHGMVGPAGLPAADGLAPLCLASACSGKRDAILPCV